MSCWRPHKITESCWDPEKCDYRDLIRLAEKIYEEHLDKYPFDEVPFL